MQLYEISNQYQKAFDEMQELDFDEQTVSDSLSLITDDFNTKAINVSSFIKNLEADTKAMKEAEEAICARRKAIENKVNNIKEYLRSNMEACGITHIHHPLFDIKLKKCPQALIVTNEKSIPSEYFDTIPETKVLNKVRLKNDLKSRAVISAKDVLKECNSNPFEETEKTIDECTDNEMLEAAKAVNGAPIAPIIYGCSLEQKTRLEIK